MAADLLAQAEHGPSSPACLVTTSDRLAAEVEVEIDRQLQGLATRDIAGAAWRDYGSVYLADSPKTAVEIMDLLAPEHLEILADDLDFYLGDLHNYGSLFLGDLVDGGVRRQGHVGHQPRAAHRPRCAVHRRIVGDRLPQAAHLPAGHQGGDRDRRPSHVVTIADFEGMPGHRDSAQLRLDLIASAGNSGSTKSPLGLTPRRVCIRIN